jgi:hypothetical protein
MCLPLINMPKQLILILLCISSLLSCKHSDQIDNRYQIVFEDGYWIKVNLKSNILSVDYDSLKYADTLMFTKAENQELLRAFNDSELSEPKGEIQYDPDMVITMPAFYQSIKVYKGHKLISNIKINVVCKRGFLPFGAKYQAIKYRDNVTGILGRHKKFKESRKRLQKCFSDHHLFYL